MKEDKRKSYRHVPVFWFEDEIVLFSFLFQFHLQRTGTTAGGVFSYFLLQPPATRARFISFSELLVSRLLVEERKTNTLHPELLENERKALMPPVVSDEKLRL